MDKTILYPPHNMIKCNNSDEYKNVIEVDTCLVDEIELLWKQGIHTCGCCCGHGKIGFIQVIDEDIKNMRQLGYEQHLYSDEFGGVNRKDAFVPKSKCMCKGED